MDADCEECEDCAGGAGLGVNKGEEKQVDQEEEASPVLKQRSPVTFFCWWLLGFVPGGAPLSQLSSGVKDAVVIVTV